MSGATAALAGLVVDTTWEALAAQAHHAKRALLNMFATALGSANDKVITAGLRTAAPFGGTPCASVIGRPERLDPMWAAFFNAIAANLLDYDDTHMATIIHPAAPVAAPVLSMAEATGHNGRDVLAALILGMEVECRIGLSVSPGHYARGWHITSTCGVFGSAAAVARLYGLSVAQTAHALGIAASESAGIVENLPTAAKNVSVGNAARNGIVAALLAEAGYEAAPLALEGKLGWARACGDQPDLASLYAGLGEQWEMAKNTFKPYPAGIVFHAVIDACLALRARLCAQSEEIESVRVEGSALLLARGDRPVRNERDARVSIHHAVACGLVLGVAGPREFEPITVNDPAIAAMRNRVHAALDPSMPDGAARVTISTRGGGQLTETVTNARGNLQNPLSDVDLEAKLRQSVREGGGRCEPGRLIDLVWSLDQAETTEPLMRAATSREA